MNVPKDLRDPCVNTISTNVYHHRVSMEFVLIKRMDLDVSVNQVNLDFSNHNKTQM